MRRVLKSRLFSFILGLIVMAGIAGVYAINASDITYNNTTVDAAIDDLYNLANAPLTFGTPITAETLTTMSMDERQQTIELPAGKYILTATINYAWIRNGTLSNVYEQVNIGISGSTSPSIRKISCKKYQQTGTTAYINNNYVADLVQNCVYYVELSQTDTLSFRYKDSGQTNTAYPYIVAFQAIPITN